LPDSGKTIDETVKANLPGIELTEGFSFMLAGIRIKVRRVTRGYVYDVIIQRPSV
jgi:hypothetical protein